MLERRCKPSLPGEILQGLFLKDRGITIKAFAQAVGCTPKHISNIIHGKARIEADLATRFAAVLGTTAQIWLNLQNSSDLWEAKEKMKDWKPVRTYHAEARIN